MKGKEERPQKDDTAKGMQSANGDRGDYLFEVTGVFKKCLDRQVDEGLRMTKCEAEGGQMLNSKNEYYTPKIVLLLFRQL